MSLRPVCTEREYNQCEFPHETWVSVFQVPKWAFHVNNRCSSKSKLLISMSFQWKQMFLDSHSFPSYIVGHGTSYTKTKALIVFKFFCATVAKSSLCGLDLWRQLLQLFAWVKSCHVSWGGLRYINGFIFFLSSVIQRFLCLLLHGFIQITY